MKTFILGILVAILSFVLYPQRVSLYCAVMVESSECLPAEIATEEVVAKAKAPPVKEKQKVYKWTDDQGVVHYGEQEQGNAERIDESLDELTVISGGQEAMERNQSAASQLRSTTSSKAYRSSSSSASTSAKASKKKRCAYLAGKRDGYKMKDSGYKRYSTQYGQECIF